MEGMVNDKINPEFWRNRKVFVTGHTGFKGTWLCLWLHSLGACVTGYSLKPPTQPNLYQLCRMEELITSRIADVRDSGRLTAAILGAAPDIVFHLAAQPLVGASYEHPKESFETNVMGTVHLLEAVRQASQNGMQIKAVVNVTTDKVYDNQEWVWGYRESDSLGGHDPYSASKACSELITDSYRKSYRIPIATARAGNVIGGGDWAEDRLVPDIIKALLEKQPVQIRHPKAVRPWQHVLEPLYGYLLLAERLAVSGESFAQGWNFGPHDDDVLPVEWIVKKMCEKWGDQAAYKIIEGSGHHEARCLKLDCSKAKEVLGWHPHWNLDVALSKVIDWLKAYQNQRDMRDICLSQIRDYVRGGYGV